MAANFIQPQGGTDDEPDLLHILSLIWYGKWIIIGCVALCLGIGVFYVREIAVPRFEATARMLIEQSGPQVVDLDSVVAGTSTDRTAMNTELAIIRSRANLEQLVRTLNLHEDPEFNPYLREQDAGLIDGTRARLRALIFGPPPPRPEQTEEQAVGRAMSLVNRAIRLRIDDGTFLFTISVVSEDPRKAGLIANAMADIYVERQVETKFEAVEYAVDWLSDRVAELEEELREDEADVEALRSRADVTRPEALEPLLARARDLEQRLGNTEIALETARSDLEQLRVLRASGDAAGVLNLTNDPVLRRLLNGEDADAPRVLARMDTLVSLLEDDVTRQIDQAGSLERTLSELRVRIDEATETVQQLELAAREMQATRTLYDTFVARLKETSLQIGLQRADSRLISPAGNGRQVEPRSRRIYLLSIALGFLIGTGAVLLRRLLQRGFASRNELESGTQLAVLGQIPLLPIRRRDQLVPYLIAKPTSSVAESIRNLRTSVTLSNPDAPPRVIMVTSSIPGEGKTTVSIALAMNLAGLKRRVLLIEGDIRRQTLSQYLPADTKHAGIVQVMSGETSLSEAVYHEETLGADILLGEDTSVNAADLFASERFAKLMETVKNHYDHVVIDTPPCLVVPDARVIGRYADSVLYAVKWASTDRGQVTEGIEQLRQLGIPVSGTILTQIDAAGMKRYGYGGGYGTYYARYGQGYYHN